MLNFSHDWRFDFKNLRNQKVQSFIRVFQTRALRAIMWSYRSRNRFSITCIKSFSHKGLTTPFWHKKRLFSKSRKKVKQFGPGQLTGFIDENRKHTLFIGNRKLNIRKTTLFRKERFAFFGRPICLQFDELSEVKYFMYDMYIGVRYCTLMYVKVRELYVNCTLIVRQLYIIVR